MSLFFQGSTEKVWLHTHFGLQCSLLQSTYTCVVAVKPIKTTCFASRNITRGRRILPLNRFPIAMYRKNIWSILHAHKNYYQRCFHSLRVFFFFSRREAYTKTSSRVHNNNIFYYTMQLRVCAVKVVNFARAPHVTRVGGKHCKCMASYTNIWENFKGPQL